MEQLWRKYGDMTLLFLAIMFSSSFTTRLDKMFADENAVSGSFAVIGSWFLLTAFFEYGMRKNKKINSPPAD